MHKLKRIVVAITFSLVLGAMILIVGKNDLYRQSANDPKFEINTAQLKKDNGVAILSYHRIIDDSFALKTVKLLTNNNQLHDYNVTTSNFEKQIRDLKKARVKFIDLKTAEKLARNPKKIKGKYVSITFDDMAESAYKNAYPILRQNKIPFASFIITSRPGKYVTDSKMASWSHLREMQKSGLVTLSLHTHDMHFLENNIAAGKIQSYNKNFRKDYIKSYNQITEHLKVEPQYFAAPYGNINKQNASYLENHTPVKGYFNLSQEIIGNSDQQGYEISRILVNENNWKSLKSWITA
ncbi:polysaccharide deacetylase family protein [Pediococcus stilesii]|uniref:Xylanase chitin deacetylase n=1 Tax=Pediococcus stilesii TaxID=331679 RepID=A0A0R2KSP1_9LACO|nr:polysaccharide deacetylase family protein [Pediococcus stilesii]KRN92595.1 xylanase chitin deacetylase [Pediococcus stilesii]